MSLPDFIGIGGQRAGSTWMYNTLSAHPQIWTTPRKEIHYFDRDADWRDPKIETMKRRSMKHRMSHSRLGIWLWFRKYSKLPRDDRWYTSLFRPGRKQIAGEVTPDYYVMDEARIAHVHRVAPRAKLILSIRNPIERTWSQTLLRLHREKRNPEEMPMSELCEVFDRENIQRRSNYLQALEKWCDFYPKEQIFIAFMEDIHFHTFDACHDIFGFLGVDPDFKPPEIRRKVNSRSRGSMPTEAAKHLAHSYREDLELMQKRFGGYTSFWLHSATKLIEGGFDHEERVPIPLWDSSAWEEWLHTNPSEHRFQSSPLSEFDKATE